MATTRPTTKAKRRTVKILDQAAGTPINDGNANQSWSVSDVNWIHVYDMVDTEVVDLEIRAHEDCPWEILTSHTAAPGDLSVAFNLAGKHINLARVKVSTPSGGTVKAIASE